MMQKVEDCAVMNLRRTARQVAQFYDHELRGSELRITQFILLAAIQRLGPISISRLADFMGMDRTTLTRNLKLLGQEGFADMRPGEDDARTRIVTLTKAGITAVENTMPRWHQAQTKFLKAFGTKRWRQLRQELDSATAVVNMHSKL